MMDAKRYIKVLLVDDDKDDRQFFCEALSELSLKTILTSFSNGKELMNHLYKTENQLPDIIFIDLNMPVMGGLECLKLIKNTKGFQDITVAIYSSSSSEKDIEESLIQGANVFLKKPAGFDELKNILHKVITVNNQYSISGQSRENFVMVV